jgi:hypothetical protein
MPLLAHFGIGLASKRIVPNLPLWFLLIDALFLDIMSIFFINKIWMTHGLIMALIWTAVMMVSTFIILKIIQNKRIKQNKPILNIKIAPTSIIAGFIVFSHWILDFIGWPMTVVNPTQTGVPIFFDLSTTFGLGVYTTWFGAIGMDLGVFMIGLIIYFRTKKSKK